jgi:hypothetical protein
MTGLVGTTVMLVLLVVLGNKKYKYEMVTSDMKFIPNFMGVLIMWKVITGTDTQTWYRKTVVPYEMRKVHYNGF